MTHVKEMIDKMRVRNRRDQMSHFRLLNENEINCMSRLSEKSQIGIETSFWGEIEVLYSRLQGGFTVAVVRYSRLDYSIVMHIGASRRSYKDKPNTTRGEILAFRRAIQTKPILLTSPSDVEGVPF